jgi:cytochrome c oxidase subunit 2
MLRRLRRATPLALVVLLTSCSFGAPAGATVQGRDIHDLWRVFFVAACIVAGIVYAPIVWSLVRYRRRKRDDPDALPPQFRENPPLEVAYTAIPIAIVIFLFAMTAVAESRVTALDDRPSVTIHAQGFTWGWRFAYEGTDVQMVSAPNRPPELVLPVGRPVRIALSSNDVIHSFYVPDFLFKRDAIPGHPTQFDLTIRDPGVFAGRCAEFCGLNHAFMGFTVRAVPATEYQAWLHQQQGAAA